MNTVNSTQTSMAPSNSKISSSLEQSLWDRPWDYSPPRRRSSKMPRWLPSNQRTNNSTSRFSVQVNNCTKSVLSTWQSRRVNGLSFLRKTSTLLTRLTWMTKRHVNVSKKQTTMFVQTTISRLSLTLKKNSSKPANSSSSATWRCSANCKVWSTQPLHKLSKKYSWLSWVKPVMLSKTSLDSILVTLFKEVDTTILKKMMNLSHSEKL